MVLLLVADGVLLVVAPKPKDIVASSVFFSPEVVPELGTVVVVVVVVVALSPPPKLNVPKLVDESPTPPRGAVVVAVVEDGLSVPPNEKLRAAAAGLSLVVVVDVDVDVVPPPPPLPNENGLSVEAAPVVVVVVAAGVLPNVKPVVDDDDAGLSADAVVVVVVVVGADKPPNEKPELVVLVVDGAPNEKPPPEVPPLLPLPNKVSVAELLLPPTISPNETVCGGLDFLVLLLPPSPSAGDDDLLSPVVADVDVGSELNEKDGPDVFVVVVVVAGVDPNEKPLVAGALVVVVVVLIVGAGAVVAPNPLKLNDAVVGAVVGANVLPVVDVVVGLDGGVPKPPNPPKSRLPPPLPVVVLPVVPLLLPNENPVLVVVVDAGGGAPKPLLLPKPKLDDGADVVVDVVDDSGGVDERPKPPLPNDGAPPVVVVVVVRLKGLPLDVLPPPNPPPKPPPNPVPPVVVAVDDEGCVPSVGPVVDGVDPKEKLNDIVDCCVLLIEVEVDLSLQKLFFACVRDGANFNELVEKSG